MPTSTYKALANTTLTGTDSAVEFNNIPNTYRDLVIIANWPTSGTDAFVSVQFNNDGGANYSMVQMYADSGGALSDANTGQASSRIGYTQNGDGMTIVNIMDYSATDKHKTLITRSDVVSGNTRPSAFAGRWASTSVITDIKIISASSFGTGTTFSLYGIVS